DGRARRLPGRGGDPRGVGRHGLLPPRQQHRVLSLLRERAHRVPGPHRLPRAGRGAAGGAHPGGDGLPFPPAGDLAGHGGGGGARDGGGGGPVRDGVPAGEPQAGRGGGGGRRHPGVVRLRRAAKGAAAGARTAGNRGVGGGAGLTWRHSGTEKNFV
ncbi:MAG: hypothetical protein AVDCRST_MAG68-1562, partial [uncultured Gemmatimonadetes bacterium]